MRRDSRGWGKPETEEERQLISAEISFARANATRRHVEEAR